MTNTKVNAMTAQQVNGAKENTKAAVTLSKYRNQMAWCRNKVKELLARGYRQYDITNTLHIVSRLSQETYTLYPNGNAQKCRKV
jgi:hypothetical protein